jgi:hypothetical protein
MSKKSCLYICNTCNKSYSSSNSLWNHTKKIHINNQKSSENIPKNSDNILKSSELKIKQYNCRYCNLVYNNVKTRWSHEQKCKVTKTADKDLELEKIKLEKLKEENKLIKLKIKLQNIKRLDNKTFKAVNKYLMDRSYNNNVNSNNTINNNYQILSIGNEQLKDVLTLKDKKEIINFKLCALEKMVEIVHCGNYHKFKNIVITNLKDNFAYKYDENKGYFITTTKNEVFNDLVSYRITDIEEIYDELSSANKIDDKTKELIQNFLDKIQNEDQPFTDHNEDVQYPNYKSYKINNIKILLYNNQDKITKDIALLFSDDTVDKSV